MEMEVDPSFANSDFGSTQARSAFHWGGTIFALFLSLMNRTGWRSDMQTNLLVLYLFTSVPSILFNILRGQFGCWVAFLAVASNLFFLKPFQFPVSSYLSLDLIGWRIDCEMTCTWHLMSHNCYFTYPNRNSWNWRIVNVIVIALVIGLVWLCLFFFTILYLAT